MSNLIKAILTDIEGTTSSIDFVHKTLFAYSKAKLETYILQNKDTESMRRILFEILNHPQHCPFDGDFYADGTQLQSAIDKLKSWIDADAKVTVLKDLQGKVWEEGYEKLAYKGHVFEEAYKILQQFNLNGLKIYVYSSGSVHAQKLIFKHSVFGDLTYLFNGYFDTRMGAKKDPKSYTKIYSIIYGPSSRVNNPDDILFFSDNSAEIEAAQQAGFKALLINPQTGITIAQINAAGFKFAKDSNCLG